MKKLTFLLFALFTALVFTACSGNSQPNDLASISGGLVYRERLALPDDASVTVRLVEMKNMNAPGKVISRQSFVTEGQQVPLHFSLNYDPRQISASHDYVITAQVDVSERLLFITNTVNKVITDTNHTYDPTLMLVRASD
ncbi:YbaY family lipoprotein [Salinivibrio sp. ES.052]|uniref:YbaY family lipoprotein n=1 Tax=Salinivibrio sp. ES.052 TaxID=1882823 RepID=UPI000928221D|nr:YbaY family lipoprotein [Salinivibrio sp. ES.052]SIN95773.1 putative lipoprotein [Salinivibrio sp. ES.052]